MLPAHTAEWSEVEWSGADEREFVYPQLNGITKRDAHRDFGHFLKEESVKRFK